MADTAYSICNMSVASFYWRCDTWTINAGSLFPHTKVRSATNGFAAARLVWILTEIFSCPGNFHHRHTKTAPKILLSDHPLLRSTEANYWLRGL